MKDIMNLLFETNAFKVAEENKPFWYTSGKIGPYFINADYLYGSGTMYSKIFTDKELHKSNEIYKNFPDSQNYDYSNKESNQRNYIKVKVNGEKYTRDSTVLLTFECNEKTKVDITSTSINHFSSVNFINDNRENIFYLGNRLKKIVCLDDECTLKSVLYNESIGICQCKLNFVFETQKGHKTFISADIDVTFEDLLKLYINKIGLDYNYVENGNIYFLLNSINTFLDGWLILLLLIWEIFRSAPNGG